MAISSITRPDDANYAFQINLDTAFAVATTIRWEIHPTAGAFPLALTTPLTGTLDFSTSDTSKMVSPVLTRNHPFPRDFEIQLYNVADDTLAFTSSEQRIAGDASLPDNSRSISGGGDQNVIGLGLSANNSIQKIRQLTRKVTSLCSISEINSRHIYLLKRTEQRGKIPINQMCSD